ELPIMDFFFFTIPLYPEDCRHFAFSVPRINNMEPMKRYQWTVLPQGMMNSPTVCQLVVAAALQPPREAFTHSLIYHYMDDILICAKSPTYLHETVAHLL
ncbi:POK25 protein, partial [Chionis minor]|nr:POK25 protein [Chionis minor]